jgi:hypothetical protein
MATALTTPTPKSPMALGGGMTFAAPMPIDIDLPGSPKRFYEYGPVRFKFMLDGKYEFFSVSAKGDQANLSNEVKIDMSKKTASYKAGLKGKLTPNIDAQAIGKLSKDSIEHMGLAIKDPKKFGLGLMRYLDVVIGHNFQVGSEYMSFAGLGFALDPDFCFFSVLLPLRYPIKFEHDNVSVSGKIVADLIVKVGPSKEMWKALCKRFGVPNMYAWVRLMIQKANVQLPKIVTTAASAAEEISVTTALETFSTWFGAFSLAIPISFALRDFCLYICNAARASGVHDSQMFVFADAYIKTIYGLETMTNWDDSVSRVKREGFQKAAADMDQYGQVGMQLYLEKQFNGGRRAADPDGENPNRIQIRTMVERMWLATRGR